VRNRHLHDALRAFALEAAALLREDQDRGAEIEFDLEQSPRRGGPALYNYRPLTGRFIAERWVRLRGLPSCPAARAALGDGAAAYLRVNGLRGADADPALQAMLERLYEDATDLSFPEERFERVYGEVERTLYERSQPATVLAAVHGLELDVDRVDLGGGLELVRGQLADAPEQALWGDPADGAAEAERRDPNVLVTLTREISPDSAPPLSEARERFRRLVCGLRLWKPGGVALSAVGWRRTGDGLWQAFEIDSGGVARGEPWVLADGEDADLREFLAAVDRARPAGAVAWALARFEMGCGRPRGADALSDYLLGLRALLDSGGAAAGGGLGLRVAVLCAEEGERRGVQRRVELAQALERFVMGDSPGEDYVDAIGSHSPRLLVDEAERHLRALLRDVLCGYLEPDLRALADDLLLEQPASPPAPEPLVERGADPAEELETIEAAGGEYGVSGPGTDPVEREPGAGQQLDWDWDDADYSAPV